MASKPHIEYVQSRRDFLTKAGGGFGAVALTYLLAGNQNLHGMSPKSAMLPKNTHFPRKARSVIFLFMEGGPSHIDLFDPKPKLNELAGQKLPPSFGKVLTAMGE